jgi:hypothetical protein
MRRRAVNAAPAAGGAPTELECTVQVSRVHYYLGQARPMLKPRYGSPPLIITMLLFARPCLLQLAV